MNGTLVRDGVRGSAPPFRYLSPVAPARSRGMVSRLHTDVEREFGAVVPLIDLHSPAPAALAACWTMLREILVADGFVDRTTKEAVGVAVSLANSCDAGAALHLAVLERLNAARVVGTTDNEFAAHADHRVRAMTEWARGGGRTMAVRSVPGHQVPELVGMVLLSHYLNRMASVFLPDGRAWSGEARRAPGRVARLATRPHRPGAALGLLAAAPLPADLCWAAGSPNVAAAVARAAAVVDALGARVAPPSIRGLVLDELTAPEADPDRAVARLSDEDRPVGRLAVLTALAPRQVDDAVVGRFRRIRGGDRELVELTQWASLAAARVVAGRAATHMWTPDDRPVRPVGWRRTPRGQAGRVRALRLA